MAIQIENPIIALTKQINALNTLAAVKGMSPSVAKALKVLSDATNGVKRVYDVADVVVRQQGSFENLFAPSDRERDRFFQQSGPTNRAEGTPSDNFFDLSSVFKK